MELNILEYKVCMCVSEREIERGIYVEAETKRSSLRHVIPLDIGTETPLLQYTLALFL
jgi:hypothetical protein